MKVYLFTWGFYEEFCAIFPTFEEAKAYVDEHCWIVTGMNMTPWRYWNAPFLEWRMTEKEYGSYRYPEAKRIL